MNKSHAFGIVFLGVSAVAILPATAGQRLSDAQLARVWGGAGTDGNGNGNGNIGVNNGNFNSGTNNGNGNVGSNNGNFNGGSNNGNSNGVAGAVAGSSIDVFGTPSSLVGPGLGDAAVGGTVLVVPGGAVPTGPGVLQGSLLGPLVR